MRFTADQIRKIIREEMTGHQEPSLGRKARLSSDSLDDQLDSLFIKFESESIKTEAIRSLFNLMFEAPEDEEKEEEDLEAGEAPEACAAREVEEETGYRAGTLAPLTEFFASPGILNERMYGFLATDLEETAQALDHDEQIEVFPIPQWQVRDMLKDGHIEDAKTITLLLYWMHLYSP